jgi:hypothetical protein
VFPQLYQRIVDVGSLAGIGCQHEVREITATLYGMFARQVHPAFVQALMLFIWCSDGSPQADLLNTMMLEYVQTPTGQLQTFRQGCGSMQASGWSSASLGGIFATTPFSSSVGLTRLCPHRNRKQFYSHWVFLWTCAVESMTRSRYEATPEDALRHIDEAHFVPQGELEDTKAFVARIKVAYERTRSELMLLNRMDRLPHEDTLVRLVYRRALRSVSLKVKDMLQTTESLSERDMTMRVVVALYLKASYKRQQTHAGLDEALAESAPPSKPTPTKPPSVKPPRPTPRVPQVQPGSPAPSPQAPPGRQREAADQTGLLPNKTKHLPEAKRTEMAKDPRVKCHNCGDDGAFHAHPPAKCPFLRWDNQAWYHPHEPVARKQTPPVVAPTVLPGSSSLAPPVPTYEDEEVPVDVRTGLQMAPPQPEEGTTSQQRSAIAQAYSAHLAWPEPDPNPDPDPNPTLGACPCYGTMSWGWSSMSAFLMGIWFTLHACMSWHVPLLCMMPIMLFVVCVSVLLQHAVDSVYDSLSARLAYAYSARGKHARTLLALVVLSVCVLFPVVDSSETGSVPCIHPYRTQFVTDEVVVAQAISRINRVGVFNAFIPRPDLSNHDDIRVTVGPDTFADISLIDPSIVDPSWDAIDLPPISVSGFDGPSSSLLVRAVRVPLRLQWGAPVNHIYAFVAPTPANVDFLMGCDVMDAFGRGATVDRGAKRVIFPSERLAIPLETIQSNLSRVSAAPLRVLATCSGCNFVYCTIRNLGLSIAQWSSIEVDPECRKVTAQVVPESQLHEPCHDVTHLPPRFGKSQYDLRPGDRRT